MVKKEEKITHAAHIKKRTEGTSNEISFSVLDALKETLDEKKSKKKGQDFSLGDIALFTLPQKRRERISPTAKKESLPLSDGNFVSADTAKSPFSGKTFVFSSSKTAPAGAVESNQSLEDKIARRKVRRRLSKITILSLIAATAIGLLIMGGTYIYQILQRQQNNIDLLDGALELIDEADKTIASLNSLISDPFDKNKAINFKDMQGKIENAQYSLDEADKTARTASAELYNSQEKEVANQAVLAVEARQTLLKTGFELLVAIEQATEAAKLVDEAWEKVVQADDRARSAAVLIKDTTDDNVELSKEKTEEAIALLNEAYNILDAAQKTYPAADLSPLCAYVEKRTESLQFAIASDEALLAKNKEEALAQNEAYNKSDAEAAAQAKTLPPEPARIIFDAYEESTRDVVSVYAAAGSQAGTADAFIRNYLGVENK